MRLHMQDHASASKRPYPEASPESVEEEASKIARFNPVCGTIEPSVDIVDGVAIEASAMHAISGYIHDAATVSSRASGPRAHLAAGCAARSAVITVHVTPRAAARRPSVLLANALGAARAARLAGEGYFARFATHRMLCDMRIIRAGDWVYMHSAHGRRWVARVLGVEGDRASIWHARRETPLAANCYKLTHEVRLEDVAALSQIAVRDVTPLGDGHYEIRTSFVPLRA